MTDNFLLPQFDPNDYLFESLADHLPGKKQRKLLKFLIDNIGREVSRTEIYNAIYNKHRNPPLPDIIKVWICHLKQYLKNQSASVEIQSVSLPEGKRTIRNYRLVRTTFSHLN